MIATRSRYTNSSHPRNVAPEMPRHRRAEDKLRRPRNDRKREKATREGARLLPLLAPALLLAAVTLLVFLPAAFGAFLDWDDHWSIRDNRRFNPPTLDSLGHYWSSYEPRVQLYVPVMYTAWWLVAHQGQGPGEALSPVPFHLLNLVCHAANAALAFLIVRRLVEPLVSPGSRGARTATWAAAVAAAAFALHPLQVEAAAWASTLYTPLSGTFSLLAVWQFMRFTDWRETADDEGRRRAWLAYAIATACFVAALLTKPTSITLPLIVLAIEWGLRGRSWRALWLPLAGWALASVPVVVLAKLAQPMTAPYWPIWQRPFLAADALTFYLQKLVAPVGLITDYGRSPRWVEQAGEWKWTWIIPALLTAGAVWLAWRRRQPWPLAALVLFVAAPLPMLGLTPFDYQRFSAVADRYVYLGLLGPALLAAYLLVRRPRPTWVWGIAWIGVAAMAVLSHRQTYRWHDSRSLFNYTLSVNPRSLAANSVLGFLAASEGDDTRALELYRKALDANPGDANALYLIGNVHLRRGRFAEAVEAYQLSARTWANNVRLQSNLGVALFQSGRPTEAVEALKRALEIDPQWPDANLNMALVCMGLQDWRNARLYYERVLALDPNSAAARRGLAKLSSIGQ
jgi:tetratricopeptide (TPR) repeat protein